MLKMYRKKKTINFFASLLPLWWIFINVDEFGSFADYGRGWFQCWSCSSIKIDAKAQYYIYVSFKPLIIVLN